MNQPKFKFGDKVKCKKEASPFYVNIIRWSRVFKMFEYMENEHSNSFYEQDLELHQEPQKKKLYAYRLHGKLGEIKMLIQEIDENTANVNYLIRELEYDTEYPEAK